MRPPRRRWISLALALVLGTYTGDVFGQNSGGRFGGSRFGSSRSSSSGSSYRSSSSSGSSYRSSSGSSYRSSSGSSGSSWGSSSSGSSSGSYRAAPPPPPPRTRPADYRRVVPLAGTLLFSPTPRNVSGEESRLAHPLSANYYGPAKPLAGLATGTVVFGLLAGLTVLVTRPRKPSPAHSYSPPPGPTPGYHPGWEVRRVSVALDWSVRALVQKALAETSARFDMNTAHGLHGAASAARNCLLQYLTGARYGAFQSFAVAQHECEGRFGQMADGLRQRYLVETVNNARRVAMNATARSEEGHGLVVVTLIVAVEGALPALPTTLDVPSLGGALGTLIPSNPERLLALEVVWSPSEENDRMSSAELETVYPELVRLAGDASPLGRRACSHCRAVYAGELGRCPACGAVG